MTTPDEHDDFLRDALEDAVCDVEPIDRLVAIRARTSHRSRRGWYAVGGAVLAAGAVVVALAVVTTGDDTDERPDVAASTTTTPTPDPPAVVPPDETTPIYYVGAGSDGPDGQKFALYRYFEPAGDPLELLMSTPSDPDYRTLWDEGSLRSYAVEQGRILVEGNPNQDGADQSDLAMQQLVYTLQAYTGTRLPVQVTNPAIRSVPVPRAAPLDVLSHVSISDPGERYAYSGSLTARGVGNGFEGTIACRLVGEEGDEVWSGATIAGAGDDLAPWELEVDLTGVEPGGYVLICQNDDPTGGAEGRGVDADTRSITVTQD